MNRNAAPIHFDQYGTNCLFYIDDEETFQFFYGRFSNLFAGHGIMAKPRMDTLYFEINCIIFDQLIGEDLFYIKVNLYLQT